MRGANRDLGKFVASADQATPRAANNIAVVDVDFRAERLQTIDEEVNRTCADRAAAWERDASLTHTGQQWSDDPEARAHLRDELVGRQRVNDAASSKMDRAGIALVLVFAPAIDGIINTMIAEDADQLLDIRQMRHVFQRQRVVGQQ